MAFLFLVPSASITTGYEKPGNATSPHGQDPMKDFRELKVWQKAHRLTLAVYAATRGFPPEERYGLTSQLRRASFSIPNNLAEGCGRSGDSDFARFCWMAMGSASELEYLLLLARDLQLLTAEQYPALTEATTEIKRMLAALLQKLFE
ncbi:MAG: four helix bundle protein [Bryobacteraceae bacterium]|nr:four helix bundle protein [Bryobacteraceae bacterium]